MTIEMVSKVEFTIETIRLSINNTSSSALIGQTQEISFIIKLPGLTDSPMQMFRVFRHFPPSQSCTPMKHIFKLKLLISIFQVRSEKLKFFNGS